MSYVQDVIAIKETILEYQFVEVPTGTTAPTPATGYQIQLVFTDIAGKAVYIEYKTSEQDHVCPTP